jgi:protein-L-isoaspartate(D-aspartate) O-methyltransferase
VTPGGSADPYRDVRWRMVREQLARRGIRDPRVLDAMAAAPRHLFVDASLVDLAYGDHALPSCEGQTISQPWIVGRMLELARLEPDMRVLEIGTGTGYQTLLLSMLVAAVYSVERVATLVRAARVRLDALGARNVALHHGDGSLGWQQFAPYDRVLVAAAAPRVPEALRVQSSERGLIVIPVGGPDSQVLETWERGRDGAWTRQQHRECRFVPLVGRDAWDSAASEESGRGSAW